MDKEEIMITLNKMNEVGLKAMILTLLEGMIDSERNEYVELYSKFNGLLSGKLNIVNTNEQEFQEEYA